MKQAITTFDFTSGYTKLYFAIMVDDPTNWRNRYNRLQLAIEGKKKNFTVEQKKEMLRDIKVFNQEPSKDEQIQEVIREETNRR